MDPSQFDALTRELAQLVTSQQHLQTQIAAVQTEIAATREESRHLAARLDNFEQTPRSTDADNSEASYNVPYYRRQGGRQHPRRDQRNRDQGRDRERDHGRRDNHSPPHHDERYFRNIKLDAPTFDGCLDPRVFTQWIRDMDRFLAWYGVPEDRRVQFASLKLIGTAQLFWESVEDLLERRRAPPVGSWEEMKRHLQEKYLPQSYKGNLLDQWNTLTQGNRLVTEYVTQFNEFRMRCHVVEDEAMTLSRFRQGLKDDLRRELILRGITTLDHAYSLVQDYELVTKTPYGRRVDNHPFVSSVPPPPVKSLLGPPPSNVPPVLENKGKAPEIPKTFSLLQCFNCKGFGHIASRCPSRALVIEERKDVEDLDSVTSVPDTSRLNVVRCTLTHPKVADDWRRHAIFHTYIKINNKGCKIIVDSSSCINAVSVATVSRLGLQPVPHPQPYNVSWVDTSSIAINERCLVPIQFLEYKDHIWCDVIPMDVGYVILGRPWLFDLDVTIYGRSNSCSFVFNGKKIHLNPLPPKLVDSKQAKKIVERKGLHMISPTEFERTVKEDSIVFAVVIMEVPSESPILTPDEVQSILQEFRDVFPEDLPDLLSPLRDIQHAIDLVPGSSLPNLPHYRMNRTEHAELQRQVEELLHKGFIRESLSPCAVPALLTPKKDGSWRMCVDNHAINKITGSTVFQSLDLMICWT
ncbi:uncharacterized protein LOC111405037 [Olea europaea var. sylvestris]|uniref:uncharacterized protein LOC111405037 n=1 Tax=Olea europaea var. sylvestris TaxID=158386 RepID=UPI000C1D00D1|nr:uncharacterized protein LOC111405037 [Olea europaea var. sylvestris]